MVARVAGKVAQTPPVGPALVDTEFVVRRIATTETTHDLGGMPTSADRSRQTLRATLDRQPYAYRPLTPNRRPSRRL